jgi:integrase
VPIAGVQASVTTRPEAQRGNGLLQAGVDCSVIALWLGHESIKTTQTYLHAHLALKDAALAKLEPYKQHKGSCGVVIVPSSKREF